MIVDTEIGKIRFKYDSETESYKKIRVIDVTENNVGRRTYKVEDITESYRLTGECRHYDEEEFKELYDSWDVLSPEGVVTISNIVVKTDEFGKKTEDIVIMYFSDVNAENRDTTRPLVIARQTIENFFDNYYLNNAEVSGSTMGVSITEDSCPVGMDYMDFARNYESIINSKCCNVYKTDVPGDIALLLSNTNTSRILKNLYDKKLDWNKWSNPTIWENYKAKQDDSIDGYCNSLKKFIGDSECYVDILRCMGITYVTFDIQPNVEINDENRLVLSMMYGGINFMECIPLKFDYDINLRAIAKKFILLMDRTGTLYIVSYKESPNEIDRKVAYEMTEGKYKSVRDRLISCIKAYDDSHE